MRKNDTVELNGKIFVLYWQTALDGKRYCRIRVYDNTNSYIASYQYRFYFKTKKEARSHILSYSDII